MVLLLGAVTSLLVQGGKLLVNKIGKEASEALILGSVFLISLVFTILKTKGVLSVDMINTFVFTVLSAVATYEIILKNIMPAYKAIFKSEK